MALYLVMVYSKDIKRKGVGYLKSRIDLKKARNKKNYTQEKMAEYLKCSRRHYGRIEKNQVNPSVKLAKEIGTLLNIDWTLLFKD